MLKKKYIVSNAIVSEMELIRFFTTLTKLKLVKSETGYQAFERLLAKLPQVSE
jgi:hypothetical protein